MAALETRELGVTGLRQFGGRLSEEWLRRLHGERGQRVYREMADNDETIGAVLFAIEMLIRNAPIRVEAWSQDPIDQYRAEFADSLLDDMSHTRSVLMAEILSMLVFGYSLFELVYKLRVGPEEEDPARRSKHTDGLVGIRKLAPRAQETIFRWNFDEDGGVKGAWQLSPTTFGQRYMPIEKLLLFRTTVRKGNPEGRSALRNCFVPWWRKKSIAEAEAIGISRDLTGLPRFRVPGRILGPNATANEVEQRNGYLDILERLQNDEMAGLMLPSDRDAEGQLQVDFDLVTSGGRRVFDTPAIIQRYDTRIAATLLADFVFLGSGSKTGSYALSSDKTELFATAIGAWLGEIADVLNRHMLPRVFRLNGWPTTDMPRYVFGDIEKPDVDRFAAAIAALTTSGHITPGGQATETHLRAVLGLPEEDALAALPAEPSKPDEGQPPAPTGPAPATPAGPAKDPTTALNGAQVQALMGIVEAAAQSRIPRASALELIVASFPVPRETADRILGDVGKGFKPAIPDESGGPAP